MNQEASPLVSAVAITLLIASIAVWAVILGPS